jgi:O-antigen/teichoic acid export membrane protein
MSIAFNLVYLKGDVLVLSLTRSSAEVGLYGAAYKILDVLTVVPMMFMGLVLPLLTRAWTAGDPGDFRRILQRSFDFMALVAAPLVVGTWVVGRDLMTFFASTAFTASGRLLGILIIACGAVFFGSTFGHAIIALGRQKAAVKWYAVDAVLSFIGYILFVPKWGSAAAAWVTVFSEVFIAVSTYLVVRQASQFAPKLGGVVKSVLAAGLMGLVVLMMPNEWNVLIRIILGIGLYAIAALTFGAVTPAQLKELRPKKA